MWGVFIALVLLIPVPVHAQFVQKITSTPTPAAQYPLGNDANGNSLRKSLRTTQKIASPSVALVPVQRSLVQMNAVSKYLESLRIKVQQYEGVDEDARSSVIASIDEKTKWVGDVKTLLQNAPTDEAMEETLENARTKWKEYSQIQYIVAQLSYLAHFKTVYDRAANMYAIRITPAGEDDPALQSMKESLNTALASYQKAVEALPLIEKAATRETAKKTITTNMKKALDSLLEAVEEGEEASGAAR